MLNIPTSGTPFKPTIGYFLGVIEIYDRGSLDICPCCGYRTLSSRANYDICGLCNWEDDGVSEPERYSGPNHMTLKEAKEKFRNKMTELPLNKMNFTDFKKLVDDRKKTHPIWFSIDSDSTATENEIIELQNNISLQLPTDYTNFLKEYGGGYFALSIVYSADKNSDFNLEKINKKEHTISRVHLLFSENGSGDFYGFKIEDNKCLPEILFFDHEIEQWQKTQYDNLFSFLAEIALSN